MKDDLQEDCTGWARLPPFILPSWPESTTKTLSDVKLSLKGELENGELSKRNPKGKGAGEHENITWMLGESKKLSQNHKIS